VPADRLCVSHRPGSPGLDVSAMTVMTAAVARMIVSQTLRRVRVGEGMTIFSMRLTALDSSRISAREDSPARQVA